MTRLIRTLVKPWYALAIVLGFLAMSGVVIGVVGKATIPASPLDALPMGSQSRAAQELSAHLPSSQSSSAVIVFSRDSGKLTSQDLSAANAKVRPLLPTATPPAGTILGQPPVGAAPGQPPAGGTPAQPPAGQSPPPAGAATKPAGPVIVSTDGTAALAVVPINQNDAAELSREIKDLRTALRADLPAGLNAQVTGPAGIKADIAAVFEGADVRLLMATGSVVAILLILTYRSPILWIIPLTVVGLADQVAAIAATHLLDQLEMVGDGSTTGILSVLVFGAGTDYALLLISRYRDELRATEDRREVLANAVHRTLEAIVSSAATVVVGLLVLVLSLFPATRSLGVACAIGVVIAAVSVLVALPAALALVGRWVFWPKVPRAGQASLAESHTIWRKIGNAVARRPVAYVAVTLVAIAVASIGTTQVSTGLSPAEQFLKKPEAIAASERVGQSFPAGISDPVTILTKDSGSDVAATASLVKHITSPRVTQDVDGIRKITAVIDAPAGSDLERETLVALREALTSYPQTYVGGSQAQDLDKREATSRDLKVIFPIVLGLVLLVLMGLLRSVMAPIILVGTVVLTYVASVGIAWVLFTQVFNFANLDLPVPLLAFVFLVALGVDYNIFLVSRVREEAVKHGTHEGFLRGLAATGGVITSAGVLLAAVFAVLGVLPLVSLAQMGVIICIGVLLDTLVVRTVLVPAIGLVMGDRFWWPRSVTTAPSET